MDRFSFRHSSLYLRDFFLDELYRDLYRHYIMAGVSVFHLNALSDSVCNRSSAGEPAGNVSLSDER